MANIFRITKDGTTVNFEYNTDIITTVATPYGLDTAKPIVLTPILTDNTDIRTAITLLSSADPAARPPSGAYTVSGTPAQNPTTGECDVNIFSINSRRGVSGPIGPWLAFSISKILFLFSWRVLEAQKAVSLCCGSIRNVKFHRND